MTRKKREPVVPVYYEGIRVPSAPTLEKYGLTPEAWRDIIDAQGAVCAVCELAPGARQLHIDHDHVRGWKKLPPEKRAATVRGLLCWFCNNHYVGRSITVKKARNVVAYLEAYVTRAVVGLR